MLAWKKLVPVSSSLNVNFFPLLPSQSFTMQLQEIRNCGIYLRHDDPGEVHVLCNPSMNSFHVNVLSIKVVLQQLKSKGNN